MPQKDCPEIFRGDVEGFLRWQGRSLCARAHALGKLASYPHPPVWAPDTETV